MIRNGVSGRRTAVVLAVAGASLTGGIVSYSIAVAAPSVTPEVLNVVAPEGREVPCEISAPDLDWYRQRGDQMQSSEMLPDTVSFENVGATLQFASTKPTGVDPCEGDGGGGGGGGTSCLSTFGFDPENYWVVFDFTNDVTAVNMYVATNGSFTTLGTDAIPTATACSVTYQWIVGDDFPLDFLFSGPPFSGEETVSDITAMQVAVSGLSDDGMAGYNIYGMFVCGDAIGLRVSDGTNSYKITGPPCSDYRFESILSENGAFLEYDYQDPWGRPGSITTVTNPPGQTTTDTWLPIVKPQSPLTITFGTTGIYTVKTGDTTAVNCSDPLVSTTQLNNVSKLANATWADPSPANSRIYCTTDSPLP
jgi:hypothetical protein